MNAPPVNVVLERPARALPDAAGDVCFHCGAPATDRSARVSALDGVARKFCCPACEAVANAIVGQGLADYYRLRSELPDRPESAARDDAALAAYDDAVFQRDFVERADDGACVASLLIEGVHCAACVWVVEEGLKRLPGVAGVDVNYVTRRARVRWAPGRTRLSAILARIGAIGYRAHPYRPGEAEALRRRERRTWLWRLFVAAFGMMQVMMYALPAYIADAGTMSADIEQLMRWASLALTLPVVTYSAAPFFRGAWRDLAQRHFGMDTPVALAIAVAFAASAWATVVGHGEVYFDSVTMFIAALLAGRFLEQEARYRAGDTLAHLARLVPAFADRLSDFPTSRAVERIAVASLAADDLVLVRPGESVPADGVVIDGASEVSEALLTGEGRAVAKRTGSALIGGAINLGSPLVMRVERVGAQTMLATITRLVEGAAAQRQPLAALADRYAHWFVLLILLIAAATAAAWWIIDPTRALWIAVAVLVATCPCALALATPVALTAATGALARRGFVVRRGHAIETLARATDVVFDKTGTLTEGAPRVVAAVPCGALGIADCAAIARALEAASEHPIARALTQYADDMRAPLLTAAEIASAPGAGVSGVVNGRKYRLGTRAFAAAGDAAAGDVTQVWLADAQGAVARFDLDDALKADAATLVDALRASGKTVHLLSGDTVGAVMRVATALGIAQVRAGAAPEAKQTYVRSLQQRGAKVAMAGDGVNDAPVLAQADVSIAMASGADLAQAHADAVLLTGRLNDLAAAFGLAHKTLAIVRQNLAWAVAYNLVAVPAAALGWVTPWLAAIGMSASSLAVVGNALRLRR